MRRRSSPPAAAAARRSVSAGRRSAVALAVALVLALALGGCRARRELPVLAEVPAFSMKDQDGRAASTESLRGRPWAAAFVFTRCPMVCPRVTRAMRGVQQDAAARKVPLHLVSFTVDPEFDTPEVLRAYATRFDADLATWSFLSGDADTIQATAEQGFKIAVEGKADPSRADFGISHGTQLVLVDGAGKIRGYYATNDEQALARLVEDAAALAP